MASTGTTSLRAWIKPSNSRFCDYPDPLGTHQLSPQSYGLKTGVRRSLSLATAAPTNVVGPLGIAGALWAAAAASPGGIRTLNIMPGPNPDIAVTFGPLLGGTLGSTTADGTAITLNAANVWVAQVSAGPGSSLLAILLHEVGHALGLLHSTNPSSAMWPFVGTTEVLSVEDRAAIRALYGWSGQKPLDGVGTDSAPALCAGGGILVLAWKGIDETDLWVSRSFDGEAWTDQEGIYLGASTDGPALTWDGTHFWMAWTGIAGDSTLYWARSTDARSWSTPEPIPDVGSMKAPSLTTYRGVPFMTWRGIEGDSGLYYTAWANGAWMPQGRIGHAGSEDRPAVCVDSNSMPRAVWRGVPGDDDLWTSAMSIPLDDPLTGYWEPHEHVSWIVAGNGAEGAIDWGNAASALGPVLATDSDRVFMAWRGVEDDQAVYFTQAASGPNGTPAWQWSTQVAIPDVGTSQTPGMAILPSLERPSIHLVWKGVDDDHTIWHTAL